MIPFSLHQLQVSVVYTLQNTDLNLTQACLWCAVALQGPVWRSYYWLTSRAAVKHDAFHQGKVHLGLELHQGNKCYNKKQETRNNNIHIDI